MHPTETRNQFIELRAEGLSLDDISERLNVPRATLGRWHHESIEQIQRLRSVQWHLLEEQIGHRLEDSLQRIAHRIRRCEEELDKRDHRYRKAVELVRIIRESRREYLQLRALLLAPLQSTGVRADCLTSLDPHKRDKTRQNPNAPDTTLLPPNDLQQPEPATSRFECRVTPDVRRGLTSPAPATNPTAPSANAADHNLDLAPAPDPSAPPRLSGEPPVTVPSSDDEVTPVSPPVAEAPDLTTDTEPLINTPLQRGEPQPVADPTASDVFPADTTVNLTVRHSV